MNELYIIGNGFDLFHDMKTSFWDFRNFLIEHNHMVYENINRYILSDDRKDENIFWNNLEYNLRYLNEDDIIDECSPFLKGYGDSDWSDSYHHDYQYAVSEIIDCMTVILLKEFTYWIRKANDKAKSIRPLLDLNENAIYLSFNYTTVLEQVYSIKSNKILHIHNSVDSMSDLILGHNFSSKNRDELDNVVAKYGAKEYLIERSNSEDVRVREGEVALRTYYEANYKNSELIMGNNKVFFDALSDVDRIHVLGHSLSEVDMCYFKRILESSGDMTRWNFTDYNGADISNINNFVENSRISNYEIVEIMDYKFK